MSTLITNADTKRLRENLEAFAALSEPDSGPGVTRLAYTELERLAHTMFGEYMRELGLAVRTDEAGNTIAEEAGAWPELPALGTGSHLDSVPNAGAFDGIAGVVAAMETARLYSEHGVRLARPVRFVAFAAEEGARFGQACIGSRIVAGLTGPDDLHGKRDAHGVNLAEAMRSAGIDPAAVGAARWHPDDWAAFLELHVEQGSVLEHTGVPIGLVDVISGSTRFKLELAGRASHSGGTPMDARADALAAAAEIVLLAESIATDRGTRATVGKLDLTPGSITTIAGEAQVYVDVRAVDRDRQRVTATEIVERAHALCVKRGVSVTARTLAEAEPVVLPGWVRDVVGSVCTDLDVSYRVLPSGASHDSQMVNHITPTGMIFVPSRAGVSHSPDEWTDIEDLAVGTDLLAASLIRLDAMLFDPRLERP